MTVKTRAALAALMIAASSVALTGTLQAQERSTTDSDGSRVGRPSRGAARAAGPSLSSAVSKPLSEAKKAVDEKKWPEAMTAVKAASDQAK